MVHEVGQCSHPMVELDDPARSSACLDDDRALALVDGQLSTAAREAIEAHLDTCAACRRFVSELARESLFESTREGPTDLERTGYAPGRPMLLDVALTAQDLAGTRVGVSEPSELAPVVAARSVPPPRSVRPPALDAARASSQPPPDASALTRSQALMLGLALIVMLLTALCAVVGLGALVYTLLTR